MPEATLIKMQQEEVFVHDGQNILQIRSLDPKYMQRVVDGPEFVESFEEIINLPIRKHAFMHPSKLREEYLFAVHPKVEKILNIEIKEMNRLREHASDMQHASVIDKQQMKVYQREFYTVMYAPWYRRLIWACTGEIA